MTIKDFHGFSIRFKPFNHEGKIIQIFDENAIMNLHAANASLTNKKLGTEFYQKKEDENIIMGNTFAGWIRMYAEKDEENNTYAVIECENEKVEKTLEYITTRAVSLYGEQYVSLKEWPN